MACLESLKKGMIDSPTGIAEKNYPQGVFSTTGMALETQHYGDLQRNCLFVKALATSTFIILCI
jgi:hypothetical protein